MLHEKEDKCQANVTSGVCYSVIGIHGMAGAGEMFEGATGKACPKFTSLNVLKQKLEEELRGKRILLVLDDVWYNNKNSGDREDLQKLISPVNLGKAGSRILVTSRTEAALVTLGAAKERCIPISNLGDEVFLEMFMHYALRDARPEQWVHGLRETQTVEFWRSQKDRDLMNDTMGALWWSYQYLDEQVRRCLAYCSIFPRRHKLRRDELVKLWVAEGFIKTSKPEEEMEDVAKNYFDELLSASFLQLGGKETQFVELDGEVDYFTIHDLLCDLAEEVSGSDCLRIEKGFTGEVPQDVRYLFVGTYDEEMLTEKISGLKHLRTLIINDIIWLKSDGSELLASMFTMLKGLRKLRVLNMTVARERRSGFGFSFSFPDSIGQLKHLRYFGFMVPVAHKLTVPSAFTKLYHMQVVNFGSTKLLEFSSGKDMMNLVNLRCVMSWTDLDFPNVGRLKWLQNLPYFTIKKKQGYESHQLKHLNKLQGKAAYPSLEVQAEVLEGLCTSKYLERLEIRDYHAKRIPSWLMREHNGGPKNLHTLRVDGWSQLGPAPDLGAFIHLHSLVFHNCSWDTLPGDMDHLASLKKLEIWICKNMRLLPMLPKSLEEFKVRGCSRDAWDTLPGNNMEHQLPLLRKLEIRECENIKSLPTLPKSLEEFRVEDCSWDALPGNMEHLTSLKMLNIQSCKNIRSLPTLPKSLEEFRVENCSFDALPGNTEHLTALKKLEIRSCKNIRSLPTLPKSLEEITVKRCSDEFIRSCRTAGDPNCQKIEHIPNRTFN
ncbi:hypothetical protein CFC21_105496 [Triticum aestivum]|uniref:Uncharacterized protein n=2 Tax=Triticum aestivum TaxID=4565 RepID=A0A3B6SSN2_WHEAT|nr:hypothetical protein CFC21_105496 [Triticum aestivum]